MGWTKTSKEKGPNFAGWKGLVHRRVQTANLWLRRDSPFVS
jgi:hypothetical protein